MLPHSAELATCNHVKKSAKGDSAAVNGTLAPFAGVFAF